MAGEFEGSTESKIAYFTDIGLILLLLIMVLIQGHFKNAGIVVLIGIATVISWMAR